MDALADGDELRGFRISLLVVGIEVVADLDGRDGGSDLLEVQRRVGVDGLLLLAGGSLRGGGSLGSSLVLAVLEVLDQFDSLAGADDDVPLGQLVLNLALHDGNLARDDEGAVVDLGSQIELVEELLDGGRGELAGGPRGQNGHAGRVGDEQVDGHLGPLELAGDQEVGQREVDRQAAGIVGRGAVDRVDAGGDLHGLLRVGVDVLAQAVQRQRLGVAHALHDDDRAVFQREHGRQSGLQVDVTVAELREVDDGRITEGTVVVLDGGAADDDGVREGLLHGRAGDVDDEVLVAGLLESFDGVVQLFEGSALDAEDDARGGRDGVHVGVVVLVGAVQNGLDVLDRLDGGLRGVDVFGVEDDAALKRGGLFGQRDELVGIASVVDENGFDVLALTDALVVGLLHDVELRVDLGVVHAGAQILRKEVAGHEGLLMTEHDGLAAQLVAGELDGLHGGCGGLGEEGDRLFGHVRALRDRERALRDLHAERHTRGAAAFLTVLLGR